MTTVLEGDPYLGDGSGAEAFGGADLAWAALTGWLLLPPGYLDGACGALPTPADFPAEGTHSVLRRELKETRAGRHVALCYGAHRRPVVGGQVTYSGILRGR